MSERVFRDRQLPLDGGIDVLIAGDGTPEGDVFIEYKSDMLIIYTGERARAARGGKVSAPPIADHPKPRQRIAAVPSPPEDPDYVPPSVAEQVVAEAKSRKEQHLEEEIEKTEIVTNPDEDIFEPVPPRPTSRLPKAPRDRTRAQMNALKINTTMQTSLGETEVNADLSGMLKRG